MLHRAVAPCSQSGGRRSRARRRRSMSTRKKLFSGIFALAIAAAAVFLVFQANRGSRADTQKSPPVVPVTAVAGAAQDDGGAPGRDRQCRAFHHGRRQGAGRRAAHLGALQGRRRGQAGSAAVRDRPALFRRRAQAGASQPRQGQGAARSRQRAGKALQGPARQELHLARCLRAGAHQRRHRRGERRRRRSRHRERQALARLLHHTRAGDRVRGPHPDPARQSRQGQRRQSAGDHQPGRAHLRELLGARAEHRRHPQVPGGRPAQGARHVSQRRARSRSRASSRSSTTPPT